MWGLKIGAVYVTRVSYSFNKLYHKWTGNATQMSDKYVYGFPIALHIKYKFQVEMFVLF